MPTGGELTPDDLLDAARAGRRALEPFADDDWTVPAGDLAWDVRQTVTHTADAVGWYAAHLAARSPGRLRFDFRAHDDASNTELLDVLDAAAATLAQVTRAAPPSARGYHPAGLADGCGFLAMACDEILVHCWDAARGLGVEFVPPADLAERVVRRLFPWAPSGQSSWPALLWANRRVDLPSQPHRPGPDWEWHCAPLDEWDGTIPQRQE
ncbi:MAG: maleylpyruvate isomerase N-terminal domain-containing protein [Acidimicrobiales bacterium]